MNAGPSGALSEKSDRLITSLRNTGSAVLAFSGGVDSSFLLRMMKVAGMRLLAVTGRSATVPEKDLSRAVAFAGQEGVEHRLILTGEMQDEAFLSNPPDRCFFCKQDLFRRLRHLADREGYLAVFDGSNRDDLHDYRPGRKAADLFGVRSPLAEQGLTKEDVRLLSREQGLATWDLPSSPCLSSRFPYGQRITPALLRRVEQAEEYLAGLGITTARVRVHGDTARIEVPASDMPAFMDEPLRTRLTAAFRTFGFAFISLDLDGFRSGNMNRVLSSELLPPGKRA